MRLRLGIEIGLPLRRPGEDLLRLLPHRVPVLLSEGQDDARYQPLLLGAEPVGVRLVERLDLGLRRLDLPAEAIGSEGGDGELHPRGSAETFLRLFVFREDLPLGRRVGLRLPWVRRHHQEPDLPRRDPEQLPGFRLRYQRPGSEEPLDLLQRDLDSFGGLELGDADTVVGEDRAVPFLPELPVLLERGNGGDLQLHLLVRGRQPHLRGLRDQDLPLDQGIHRLLLQIEGLGHLRREGGSVPLPVRLLEAGDGLGQLVRRDRLSAHGGGHVPVPFGVGADSPPDEGQRDEGENDLDGPGAGVAAEYGEHGEKVLLSMEMKVLSNVPF